MFSLEDSNARKLFIISVLLEKNAKNIQYSRLVQHEVVARNQEEAFGILRFAYNRKDSAVEFNCGS